MDIFEQFITFPDKTVDMIKIKTLALLMLIMLGIFLKANAQSNKTVLDYYLGIGNSTYMCDMQGISPDTKDIRISNIVRMDIREGYLLAKNDYLWIQVAIFTYSQKKIVAIIVTCGMGCMCNEQKFYEIQSNGDWKDVRHDILPKESYDLGWYILPEKGTTIKIYDYDLLDQYDFKPMTEAQKNSLKLELIWDKGEFRSK